MMSEIERNNGKSRKHKKEKRVYNEPGAALNLVTCNGHKSLYIGLRVKKAVVGLVMAQR